MPEPLSDTVLVAPEGQDPSRRRALVLAAAAAVQAEGEKT